MWTTDVCTLVDNVDSSFLIILPAMLLCGTQCSVQICSRCARRNNENGFHTQKHLTFSSQSRFKCAFEPQHRKLTLFSFSSWRLSSIDFARNAWHSHKACFEFVCRIQFNSLFSDSLWLQFSSHVPLTCSEYLLSSVSPVVVYIIHKAWVNLYLNHFLNKCKEFTKRWKYHFPFFLLPDGPWGSLLL